MAREHSVFPASPVSPVSPASPERGGGPPAAVVGSPRVSEWVAPARQSISPAPARSQIEPTGVNTLPSSSSMTRRGAAAGASKHTYRLAT